LAGAGTLRPRLGGRGGEAAAGLSAAEWRLGGGAAVAVGEAELRPRPRRVFHLVRRRSSPIQSRPLSVNHRSWEPGRQSKPTLLRTPRAKTSIALPSGFMRVMVSCSGPGGMQTLHGAPTGT